jgi:hypothetical protein
MRVLHRLQVYAFILLGGFGYMIWYGVLTYVWSIVQYKCTDGMGLEFKEGELRELDSV